MLDSKHVLKVYFKPNRKSKDFINTSSNFACLAENWPLKITEGAKKCPK